MTQRKGWCPSLFEPMPSGDGLLVRIKSPGGKLTADAARVLADAASCHGNGAIELTGRGNLQVRGLSTASVEPFAACMIACGLANRDAEVERRRNVIASPLSGDDPSLAPDTGAIAAAIERGLATEPRLAALPPKFCVLVDGGGVLPLDGIGADICVRAADTGFVLSVDGDPGVVPSVPEQTTSGAFRLARAFVDIAPKLSTAPGRMRDLIRTVGAEVMFRAAGFENRQRNQFVMPGPDPGIHVLPPRTNGVDGRIKSGHDVEEPRPAAVRPPNAVGFFPYSGLHRGAFGLGLPFGHIASETMTDLADLATQFGDGMLRTTPWRAIVLGGVEEGDAARLATFAARAGLIADPADPRRTIVACPGRPACAGASVPARADAALLAAAGVASAAVVHVSGCGKGCAHPAPAALTLVGRDGRYDVVRNGTAADPPDMAGLTIAEAVDRVRAEFAA